MTPPPRRRLPRPVFWALYVLYLAAFPLVFAVLAHAWRQTRTPPAPAAPGAELDRSLWKLVGHIQVGRRSSFVNFPKKKPPGVVRIGCFGDSFTFGDEVEDGSDYPALLQRQLDALGVRAQVLNFGNSWHGFHQSAIVWDRLARAYGVDVALWGPGGFQADRDTSFEHTRGVAPYYLHARYVLDGDDDVKLVEVLGEGYQDRHAAYNRFLPPLRYVRYDRNPPAFLRALIGPGREMANPFYYRDDSAQEEATATYRILLQRIVAQHGAGAVAVGHPSHVLLEALGALPGLALLSVEAPQVFPYLAPRGHFTDLGNDYVARRFAGLVRAEPTTRHDVVETFGVPAVAGPPDLADATTVGVTLDGREVAAFMVAGRRGTLDARVLAGHRGLAGLVAAGGTQSPVDALWIPLRTGLAGGAALALVRGGRVEATFPLRPAGLVGYAAVAAVPGLALEQDVLTMPSTGSGDAELWLGPDLVARLVRSGGRLRVDPVTPFVRIRCRGDARVELATLPPAGSVWLVARFADRVERWPLAGWRRRVVEVPMGPRPSLRPLVYGTPTADHAAASSRVSSPSP